MRKAQKLMRILSLALVLSLCFGLLATSGLKLTAKAEELTETIKVAEDNPTPDGAEWSWQHGEFTITALKNGGSNNPTVNNNSHDLRIYAKGTLNVRNDNATITKVVLNLSAQGQKRLAPITSGVGTIATQTAGDTTVTWTGSANAINFNVGEKADFGSDGSAKAGQLCIDSIVVTYTAGTTVEPNPSEDPDPSEDPVNPPVDTDPTTIADALKVESGKTVENVTGVVTFLEKSGKSSTNLYIQDAEGVNGICLRINKQDLPYGVGDTLTVKTGKRGDFNGLHQLTVNAEDVSVSAEKIELKTNETTLDKLGEANLCTYIHLTGLKVTAIDEEDPNKFTVDQNGTTILLYKPVLSEGVTLNVGDTLEFKGALGIYNDLQLRNTTGDELKVTSAGTETPDPSDTPDPSEKPEPSEEPAETKGETYVLATEVKDGDKVILVNAAYNLAINATTVEGGGKTYLTGTKVNPQSSKITTENADLVWTVKAVDGGFQLVNAKGEAISCTSGLAYGDTDNVWAFEFDGKTLKIKSTTAKGSSGDPKYIEWFEKYSQFSTYYLTNSQGEPNDPALFAMNVYVLDPEATAVKPSGNPGTADNAQLVLAGFVMVMAVAAAAAVVTQRKKSF